MSCKIELNNSERLLCKHCQLFRVLRVIDELSWKLFGFFGGGGGRGACQRVEIVLGNK